MEMGIGWRDSEYIGLGCSLPLMRIGSGIGAGGGYGDRGGGRCFCGEVSHINVTSSSLCCRDIKRQGNCIPLPTPHPQRQILHHHMATLCNYFLIFSHNTAVF